MFSSGFEYVGGTKDEADYIYYNADIINNRASDLTAGVVVSNPQIRFNETRDTPIIKDASKYNFSIVRFSMNGPGLDLPLFIPDVFEGQPDVNKTSYAVALTYNQTWNTSLGPITFNIAGDPFFVQYSPEVLNTVLAPVPPSPVVKQDVSTQYYWVRTYSHWVRLVNQTLLNSWIAPVATAYGAKSVWLKFAEAWTAAGLVGPADPFPYPLLGGTEAFAAFIQPPNIQYNPTTNLFSIQADSYAFGEFINPSPGGGPFVPTPYVAGPPGVAGQASAPQSRLFFNSNTYNLFANFEANYYNSLSIGGLPPLAPGYTWEILFPNKNWENLVSYTQPPYNTYVPLANQKIYWINVQDYPSNDNLWSPCGAIVFTTSLIPIRAEQVSAPVVYGENNLGDSAGVTASAFVPIITDIAVPLSPEGAQAYRSFIYYTPTAEYRLGDFGPSQQDVRNIDIQVFWRNRLNNQLYPVSIPNGGTVNFKLMFKHRRLA